MSIDIIDDPKPSKIHTLPEPSQSTKRQKQEPSAFEKDLDQLSKELDRDEGLFNFDIFHIYNTNNVCSIAINRHDQEWGRPPLENFCPDTTTVNFQQLDAEEAFIDGEPVVRLFGVTDSGNSIMCDMTGFLHYFYFPVPVGFRKSDIVPLTNHIKSSDIGKVDHIEIQNKFSIMHYNGTQKSPFLKIFCKDLRSVSKLRSAFENGQINYRNDVTEYPMFSSPAMSFDNINYVLRAMIDCKITGMCWITLPAGKYRCVDEHEKVSRCQLEVTIDYKDLIAHPAEGDWQKMAPLRILSFDIECAGRKGIFPEAQNDPVIQIANVVSSYGESKPFIRNVFTLDTCAPIVGTQVISNQDERKMLRDWRDFICQSDPDIVIGYNIVNFDLPYLLDRAKALKVNDFAYFGRLKKVEQVAKNTTFSSKAFGMSESKAINIDGRMQFDMLQFIRREFKLRSYTLNSVSAHFLDEQKEDVHHSIITDLQNGTDETRRRLAVYCLKDSFLPMRLMNKLMCLVNYTEMARVTGVPFSYLLTRGQQIKVISQLYRKTLDLDIVIPNLKQSGSSDEQYEGATVIEPKRGYYDVPISTLDFSSLYPSIMMAHNLCYTTLLDKNNIQRLNLEEGKDYTKTPIGECFVKAELRKGILPEILEELLGARKRAKADLKKETDPFKRAILDGRQLALKISANSVYGFTGATIGKLPCLAISSSVTAFGREMIEQTQKEVEKKYTIENGYSHDATVIYGDTDSVMVRFGPTDLETCMKLGLEAADYVSTKFLRPIKLEFEKVYFPYLLINKKRYAGLYWTKTDKPDKMDTKGIETVRRDNCRLVQNVITTVLQKILRERDVSGAESYVKNIISLLMKNQIDMSQLVITKQISRADYAAKQAHVELAERMRKRDAGSAPTLGDRVAYVITKGGANTKNYEKSEDPIYVLEHNLPIDTKYYLENQLSNPLQRIFEPILGEKRARQLLTGDHTRTISVAAPTTGGLMRFAVKTAVCMHCKRPLKRKNGPQNPGAKKANGNKSDEKKAIDEALCLDCIHLAPQYYVSSLNKVSELETKFSRLWTECQRCQGELHQKVICSSKDCPIFYMRTKAQKDLAAAAKELARFDHTDW